MSQISNNASANENQGDGRSPFELLPREIKEKILKLVVEEIEHFIVFKWFWRLKRVNKEFYSIMSSQYAQRHFPKWPCSIYFTDRYFKYPFNVYIDWPTNCTKMERNVMPNYSDQDTPPQKPMVRGVAQMCCWKDLPEYIKDKPFDLVYMNIEVTKGGDKMIPAIVEMANQTIGRIDLRIYFVHYNCFLMFGGYLYKHDEISDRLEEHMKTEKIIAYLVDEVEGEMCRATRYY